VRGGRPTPARTGSARRTRPGVRRWLGPAGVHPARTPAGARRPGACAVPVRGQRRQLHHVRGGSGARPHRGDPERQRRPPGAELEPAAHRG
ncbi:MAG: hypothetical protein AVDCRST_MAG20-2869, partial [uncultured Acidimicrobiales bacterium]